MAITNLYSNLPGHLVEFKDGGLSLREQTVATGGKSLLIIGTATDGPINEPVAIDINTVAKLFGEDYTTDSAGNQVPNGTTLTKYARQAYKAGFDDIRCMRVTGSQATTKASVDSVTTSEEIIATETVISNGNNVINFGIQASDIALSSGQTAVVKSIDQVLTSNGADITTLFTWTGDINNPANYPRFELTANNFAAKSSISCVFKTRAVNDALEVFGTGTLTLDVGTDTASGDNIHEITVPMSALVGNLNPAGTGKYAYDFSLATGSSTQDDCGISISGGKIENINGNNYMFAVEVNGSNVTSQITDITVSGNNISIKFVETGSAGTTSYSGSEPIVLKTKTYDVVENPKTITVSSADSNYTPLTVTLPNIGTGVLTASDIIVSNGATVIGKLSDNDVVSFDGTDTVTIDLSLVHAGITMNAYKPNQTLTVTYVYNEDVTTTEEITFSSIYGGTLYNEAQLLVEQIFDDNGNEGRLISLTKPESKLYSTNEQPLQYSSFLYPTFGLLKQAIESTMISPLNNVFEVIVDNEDALVANLNPIGPVNFAGGTDGINPSNDDYFQALSGIRDENGYLIKQGAYQVLENYSVDDIYVAGIYSDSTVSSSISVIPQPFHYELALVCAVLTYRTKMTHGFIDVKPTSNTTLIGIQKWVDHLLSLPNEFVIRDNDGAIIYDDDQNPMDIGWYTSTVVGPQPLVSSATLGNYYGSPAIAYAALNASIPAYSAPTNKAIPGCSKMRFKLSNKQMNLLTGKRMVCFKYKNEGTSGATQTPYVVDGCTSGLSTSDYTRLTTVKVVTQVVDEVREVSDPFIGEPNTVEQRNALAALISKRLSYLKEQGVIQYYEFEISATNYQVLLGECSIALTLVAPQELRKITTVVALKATA